MKDLIRIKQKLYCEPVLITPEAHKAMCETLTAHLSGCVKMGMLDEYKEPPPDLQIFDGVGVVAVHGAISRKISNLERGCGACGVEDVQRMIQNALDLSEVVGIVLDVDSPGGSWMGSPELANFVNQAAQIKPVIAYAGGLMASAAYYISAGASAIYASESAIVGSIGTYIAVLDSSRAAEMQGLKVELIKAGRLKAAGVPGTSLSDEQRNQLQAHVNEINAGFTKFVNDSRGGVDGETMQGQVFTAQESVYLNLVDSIATMEEAMRDVKILAGQNKRRTK